ncbi:MAG: enoyl-CoA hydratase/isomerase family protein [Bacteroidetes bacterium]|jgi:enoyl-CoA hydratase/carnithine racemase|nr:enoyl-CoA hydratase/isomerase family protein [Bacteroidota bacterium]
MKYLIIERDSYSITATLKRPGARNAINFAVMAEFEGLLDELESDAELRLFTFTGHGSSFIAGGDLKEFHSIKDAEGARDMTRRMMRILERIEALPFWTLAAVNGHTYGGGWETMLAFDFRVASASAKFGFTQGSFYLPPGWGGITRLSKAVGKSQARYWLASRAVIRSQRALHTGLVQDLFDDDEFERKLSKLQHSLLKNDRTFIEYIKRSDIETVKDEIEPFSTFWESEEHHKRVDEFLSRKDK